MGEESRGLVGLGGCQGVGGGPGVTGVMDGSAVGEGDGAGLPMGDREGKSEDGASGRRGRTLVGDFGGSPARGGWAVTASLKRYVEDCNCADQARCVGHNVCSTSDEDFNARLGFCDKWIRECSSCCQR